jgi:hypothetical protein
VIADEVEEVRRGHRERSLMGKPTTEPGLRLGHGRLEQPEITEARPAAVGLELHRVDLEYVVDVEEEGSSSLT